MKKKMLIFIAIIMVVVSACSRPSGSNGANGQANTSTGTDEKATNSPKDGTDGKKNNTEKKTIVLSTFYKNDVFVEAKKLYEAKNPHITIEIEHIESNDSDGEAKLEKFVKTTGTAMLAGKGPDILEMDQLPTDHYVNKKLLANLGEMIDQDTTFKKEQYFSNILDGVKINGGLYGMPSGFFLYGLIGDETIIEKSGVKIDDSSWDWSEFASIAKEISKKSKNNTAGLSLSTIMIQGADELLLSNLVKDQYAKFVDSESGKANFDSTLFIDLLKEVKHLLDEKVIDPDARENIFQQVQINSPSDYVRETNPDLSNRSGSDYKRKLYLKPNAKGQETGGFFRTYQTMGINANSDVKEEAWEFVKFVISDEMKENSSAYGFPINKASYELGVEKVLKKGKVDSGQPFGPLKDAMYEITQKDTDELEKFLTTAKYPVQFKDSKVIEILMEESKAYFSGQKTPEAVAKLIQNRVTTVINE
ncbi:ABC transporter substrate-binding protein [Paenibacillus glacialis]|uniref:ABC transporter substrate-binding protein n=1 Tax=Paenibacillus glacialis TaxID=494026 RepID=A0A162K242_9BACL|nr:extracellular solute-binding protein [Paenibacillus glacialis]OAB41876.1 ABC transporter substrate-binding protein [Paenibacillus glacialis]